MITSLCIDPGCSVVLADASLISEPIAIKATFVHELHDGEEFIILDLIRLLEYKADIGMLMTPFLTHELTHICIHADYPDVPAGADYCNIR